MLETINSTSGLAKSSPQTQTGSDSVVGAIRLASARSGVDFSYLLNKAVQESSLNPTAKARSSSATGLYQFIDQTWLRTVKEHGADYGLSDVADKITIQSNGKATVANSEDKKAILALRNDPEISANMAAELAKTNKESLERTTGSDVGATELYLAHFLGAGGATAFLKTLQVSPDSQAADILPKAAAANKSVFYDQTTGRARTLSEVYGHFAQKFESTPDSAAITRMAEAASTKTQTPTAPILAPQGNDQTHVTRRAYAAASTMQATGADDGTISLANGVQIGASTSSPFAAMMMAQMDMDSFGLDALARTSKLESSNDEERRKSAFKALSDIAG